MWKSRKFIIAAALAAVLVITGISGIALAEDSEDASETTLPANTVWDDVASILQEDGVTITADQLKSAFTEVQENRQSAARQNFLDKMVANGKITQEQADAYSGWMEAKPDMGEGFGSRMNGGMLGGRMKMRVFNGMREFGGSGGICAPTE